jgi:GWxTD domain-containing protein
MKYIILSFYLLLLISIESNAQNQMDKSAYYKFGKRLHYTLIYNYDTQTDSIEVKTIFKIPYHFLRFEKRKSSGLDLFTAKPRLELEFSDGDGIIRKRESIEIEINTEHYSEISQRDKFYYGELNSKIPANNYQPTIRLYDNEKTKLTDQKLNEIKLTGIKSGLNILPPILSYKLNSSDTSSIVQYIMDGNADFSSDDLDIIFLTYDKSKPSKYNYSIEYLDSRNAFPGWEANAKLNGITYPAYDKSLQLISGRSNIPYFKMDKLSKDSLNYGILDINFAADKIVPGKYAIKLWKDNSKDTLKHSFAIVWENMPLSLKNPDYAVELMYYILTEEEYDKLRSGSSKEILKKIFDYWKPKDPTKFTVYNETMFEYFRRVDVAFFNYQTFNEKDGAKTERGKIYILNGTPDKIESDMNLDGRPIEKWYYNKLNKLIIFDTDSNGIMFVKEILEIKT